MCPPEAPAWPTPTILASRLARDALGLDRETVDLKRLPQEWLDEVADAGGVVPMLRAVLEATPECVGREASARAGAARLVRWLHAIAAMRAARGATDEEAALDVGSEPNAPTFVDTKHAVEPAPSEFTLGAPERAAPMLVATRCVVSARAAGAQDAVPLCRILDRCLFAAHAAGVAAAMRSIDIAAVACGASRLAAVDRAALDVLRRIHRALPGAVLAASAADGARSVAVWLGVCG